MGVKRRVGQDISAKRNTPASRQSSTKATPAPAPVRASARVSRQDVEDIAASLDLLDEPTPRTRPRVRSAGAGSSQGLRSRFSKKKKVIMWSLAGVLVVLLAIGIFIGVRALQNGNKIFEGGILDALVKKEPLQRDKNGRSNIVIFGTSEDDEGHKGALLTDSLMILSVNQDTGASNMMSIPRDLWVQYNDPCSAGNQGKINAVYVCALENNGGDEDAASKALAAKLTEVSGLNVQYYARLNYTVIRDTVDSLGGIEVKIDSKDPRGIYDINTKLTLPNGSSTIDGETALKLSRARNAKGGYGLARSNFDREKSQRLILRGVQKKALSTGTLANPLRVTSLMDSLGTNLHTNIRGSELQTVIKIASGVQPDAIQTIGISDTQPPLVQTDRQGGQSIVRPVLGLLDYSGIIAYVESVVESTDTAKGSTP